MFAMERVRGVACPTTTASRAIEGTRFPRAVPSEEEQCDEEAVLLHAADLIGQLGDPHCIRKAKALHQEARRPG